MLKLRIYTDSIPCIMSSFILMCNISLSELSAAVLPGRLMKSTRSSYCQRNTLTDLILFLILFYFWIIFIVINLPPALVHSIMIFNRCMKSRRITRLRWSNLFLIIVYGLEIFLIWTTSIWCNYRGLPHKVAREKMWALCLIQQFCPKPLI